MYQNLNIASNNDRQKLLDCLKYPRKVVINSEHGGFGLSDAAICRYAELAGLKIRVEKTLHQWCANAYWIESPDKEDCRLAISDISRDDPNLVSVVEELGSAAEGHFSRLKIVEIPFHINWTICEHDGAEWVAEQHKTWK